MPKLPPFLVSILTLFARPLGQFILNGLTAGSATLVTKAVAYGVPVTTAEPLAAAIVGALAWAISSAAASQGVNIPVINKDGTNGVRVVNSADADAAGVQAVDAPKKA